MAADEGFEAQEAAIKNYNNNRACQIKYKDCDTKHSKFTRSINLSKEEEITSLYCLQQVLACLASRKYYCQPGKSTEFHSAHGSEFLNVLQEVCHVNKELFPLNLI